MLAILIGLNDFSVTVSMFSPWSLQNKTSSSLRSYVVPFLLVEDISDGMDPIWVNNTRKLVKQIVYMLVLEQSKDSAARESVMT